MRDVTIADNDADHGAGVFCDLGSRPHLVGCTFARNTANDGGGLVLLGDAAVIESSLFEDNVGIFSGPALTDFATTLTVTDSRFLRNRGDSGGAVTVSGGQASFERCWFEGNVADSFGGAMLVRFGASARVASSVVVANASVGLGGGLAVWTASLAIEGATIVDNYAAHGGAFLVKDGSTFGLGDSVVWRNPDDQGASYDLDGAASTIAVTTSDEPPEVAAVMSFDADPKLGNVPVATRFAEEAGGVDHLPVAGAAMVFTAGDRLELGDDGVERRVTAVSGDDVSFAPRARRARAALPARRSLGRGRAEPRPRARADAGLAARRRRERQGARARRERPRPRRCSRHRRGRAQPVGFASASATLAWFHRRSCSAASASETARPWA